MQKRHALKTTVQMATTSPGSEFMAAFRSQTASLPRLKAAAPPFQHELVSLLLTKESDPAPEEDIEKYFGVPQLPGTSSIGLRVERPDLFQDTLSSDYQGFDDWLKSTLHKITSQLSANGALARADVSAGAAGDIFEKIKTVLSFRSPEGVPLRELIPQQTYEDAFTHMVMVLSHNSIVYVAPTVYEHFNTVCHRIALATLEILASENRLALNDKNIHALMHLSVLSGYVGVNLKSTASAASFLLNRELLPIPEAWIKTREAARSVSSSDIQRVARKLIRTSDGYGLAYGLDSVPEYGSEVLDTRKATLVVFFSDDYLESIIDLKRFELLLEKNRHVTILMVPRNGRYGNDFAFEDVQLSLGLPVFKKLAGFQRQGRFMVSAFGPRGGCVDPRFFSRGLIGDLKNFSTGKTLILETKGCRNFEMLRGGFPMPWYASFNCNRALSIRTVGIDIDPVFLRIPPGLTAYEGFETPIIGTTPSGITTGVRFAQMTTRDLCVAIKREPYRKLRSFFPDELHLNTWLMTRCREKGLTVPDALESDGCHAPYDAP